MQKDGGRGEKGSGSWDESPFESDLMRERDERGGKGGEMQDTEWGSAATHVSLYFVVQVLHRSMYGRSTIWITYYIAVIVDLLTYLWSGPYYCPIGLSISELMDRLGATSLSLFSLFLLLSQGYLPFMLSTMYVKVCSVANPSHLTLSHSSILLSIDALSHQFSFLLVNSH